MDPKQLTLFGRVFIRGDIHVKTGLHIGQEQAGLYIGSIKAVIRNPYNNRPYIPGSSLRGKMRSLAEKLTGAPQNKSIGQATIHVAETIDEYRQYWVNPIFGIPGETKYNPGAPTRLIVRDVPLSEVSVEALKATPDQPYTEVKTEVAIDRITAKANPRTIERVPAGAIFEGFEMVYSVYEADDLDRMMHILEAMQLLEDDYLGGQGARGSGKIAFAVTELSARSRDNYAGSSYYHVSDDGQGIPVADLISESESILAWLRDAIRVE